MTIPEGLSDFDIYENDEEYLSDFESESFESSAGSETVNLIFNEDKQQLYTEIEKRMRHLKHKAFYYKAETVLLYHKLYAFAEKELGMEGKKQC